MQMVQHVRIFFHIVRNADLFRRRILAKKQLYHCLVCWYVLSSSIFPPLSDAAFGVQ
jgi:hypothetical protein